MFFTPKQWNQIADTKLRFTADTQLQLPQGTPEPLIRAGVTRMAVESEAAAIKKLAFHLGVSSEIQKSIENYVGNDEEYVISLGQESHIWAHSIRGFLYAMATLEQLNADGMLTGLFLYDYPVSPVRGYRVFLPGAVAIDDFKRMIDMLVYYKYNTIVLEIGGAMEYKNHPEVNEAWIAFCQDVRRYSGRAHEIQFKTYPWEKDSIHCDNGNGGVLTQDQCADIAAYCRERGIEVIPEEPTLSHTDYMCLAHPRSGSGRGTPIPIPIAPPIRIPTSWPSS